MTREATPEESLNPYCSGRWSRTLLAKLVELLGLLRLNPYCSGR